MAKGSETQVNFVKLNALSTAQWHEVLKLRSEVFVVEQACIYPDPDEQDQHALHGLWESGDELVAYTRMVLAGEKASIGRVITKSGHRSRGLGKALIASAIAQCQKEGITNISMSAQAHLCQFYRSLSFISEGRMYLEDGIPHLHMVYAPKA